MSRPASVFPFCLSPEHAAFLQRYRSVLWLRWHPVASIKRCGDPKHLASSLHALSRLSHRRVVSEADGDHVAVVSVHAREWFLCSNLARENSPGFYYNGLSAVYVTAPKDKLVDQRPDAERQCISKDPTAYLENYTAAEVTKKKKNGCSSATRVFEIWIRGLSLMTTEKNAFVLGFKCESLWY